MQSVEDEFINLWEKMYFDNLFLTSRIIFPANELSSCGVESDGFLIADCVIKNGYIGEFIAMDNSAKDFYNLTDGTVTCGSCSNKYSALRFRFHFHLWR